MYVYFCGFGVLILLLEIERLFISTFRKQGMSWFVTTLIYFVPFDLCKRTIRSHVSYTFSDLSKCKPVQGYR